MEDRNPSMASSSSSGAVVERHHSRRRMRRRAVEEDGGDPAACTGKSCQSCTAGAIADCVAVCCCPCAVVNFVALAFLKLPWAVARKYLGGLKRKSRRRGMLEERKCCTGDRDGTSENVSPPAGAEEAANGNFSAEVTEEEVWLEMYEVGHLGFGRVSFSGAPFSEQG